jgi:hypothetical protein
VLLLNVILYNSHRKVLLNDHLKDQKGSLKVLEFFCIFLSLVMFFHEIFVD